jgi:hypothetical protein
LAVTYIASNSTDIFTVLRKVHWPTLDKQFVGTVLAGYGAILAWVYLTGSRRLGVVDLFACEIITLCRVFTIMDAAKRLIEAHDSIKRTPDAPPPGSVQATVEHSIEAKLQETSSSWPRFNLNRFTSQENYFPVFQSNAVDLEVLEADVVINVTAFYTYMKVFRDQLRRLGALDGTEEPDKQRLATLTNAIYMLFLSFESARKAIIELIEFEPTQAEALTTMLMSELPAYRFLAGQYNPDDLRGRRLALRDKAYCEIVPDLLRRVHLAKGDDWKTAKATAVDLEHAYNELGFMPKVYLFD